MRCQRIAFSVVVFLSLALCAGAGSARVIKVLPHFLDKKGRVAVNPSLYDRDAYQVELRANPDKRSALRFDVQWKAAYYEYDFLTLRIEAKGMKGREPTTVALERPLKLGSRFSQWTALTLRGEDYEKFGELTAWRALLVSGTNIVTEQKSFLW